MNDFFSRGINKTDMFSKEKWHYYIIYQRNDWTEFYLDGKSKCLLDFTFVNPLNMTVSLDGKSLEYLSV